MPCVQLNSISSALDRFCKMETQSKCILLIAVFTAVLPLELHHLVAAVLGAAGYMFMQWLEPSVKRQVPRKDSDRRLRSLRTERGMERGAAPLLGRELRRERRGFTPVENQKWSALRAVPAPASLVKPEVKRPSVMPVKAPKFAAGSWQDEVHELLQSLKPNDASREQVEAIAQAVRLSLSPVLDASVKAYCVAQPMSGTAFGVAVPEVEVVVTVDGKGADGKLQKSMIRTCTDRLVSHGDFKFRRSAFRGSEPKVTLIAPAQQASAPFNLAVNALTPLRCSQLFEAATQLNPMAAELILLVRRWAKDRGVSHAAKGHLSPYGWMLLAIFYLQDAEQLPPMGFVPQSRSCPAFSPSSATSGELLKGFMKFYSSFDWAKESIAVRAGQRKAPVRALVLLHEDGKTRPGPNIEDPFEPSNNLGSGMHWLSMERLQEEFERAVRLSEASSLADLLEPWTPPEN